MYMAWMKNNIQDWCISRQLWWGHRIPAWYDAEGISVVVTKLKSVPKTTSLPMFSSAKTKTYWIHGSLLRLWTFSTLRLDWRCFDGCGELLSSIPFHPTDVLVTGFDIIFFWVARMIMFTMHFMKNEDGTPQVPFKTVYVHGLVRDGEGQKNVESLRAMCLTH